jgi:hypothetical protein
MSLLYYKKPLIILAITFLVAALILLIFPPNSTPYTPLIPFDDAIIEIRLLFIIYPLSGIIGTFLLGYILAPIFMFFHVKIFGRKLEYGIQELETPPKFKKTFRGFFPILLSVNITLILAANQDIMNILLYPDHQVSEGINAQGVIFLLMFTIGIGLGLFSAVWLINDAGILYSNRKKIKGIDKNFEVRSMSSFFMNIIKGYAGLSVLINFAEYIFDYSINFQTEGFVENVVLQIIIPFLLSFINLLPVMLFDMTKETNKRYIRKIAKKLEIVDIFEISITKKNQ